MIDNFKFGRNVLKVGLFSALDENKRNVLYIGNENKKILLKKFRGRFDYDKFLIESVLIRMMCDKKTIKKVHICYNNLIETLNDLKNYEK